MKLTLRFRPALLRSAVLLAASVAADSAFTQVPLVTDPFTGGSMAIPAAGSPVAYGDPGMMMSAPMTTGTMYAGPTSGGPVYMSPEIVGGGMPGSPGCNCGPGGTPMGTMMAPPVVGGGMMAAPSAPAFGSPMTDPSFGAGMPAPMGGPIYSDPGVGLTDPCFGGVCDPCAPVGPAFCDPCAPGGGGIYHGAGGGQRCGWSTGFSWVFLKPFYGANEAFSVTTPVAGGLSTTGREFDYSLDLSPRVFVEYVGRSDLGFRATWFGFESDADGVGAVVPPGSSITTPLLQNAGPGAAVSAGSEFDLDVIDLDVTQRFSVRRSLFNMGAGLRWASYEHDYTSAVTGPGGTSRGAASRQFDGIGPTVFAEWRRPIGTTRFSLLANIRGSMLFGEAESEATVHAPGFFSSSSSTSDDFVAVGESQLGGEWSAWISQRTVMFVQVAWETQYWMGIGTAHDRNDDVGLFGFNTTVGLEW